MELSPQLEQALRELIAAWDDASRAPRDNQLHRRALERTATFVEAARRELPDAEP